MTSEQLMEIFEKECATWGFDFSRDDSNPDGGASGYASHETGIMFGMFVRGFDTAKEHFGVDQNE